VQPAARACGARAAVVLRQYACTCSVGCARWGGVRCGHRYTGEGTRGARARGCGRQTQWGQQNAR